jgi:hypothetical protein
VPITLRTRRNALRWRQAHGAQRLSGCETQETQKTAPAGRATARSTGATEITKQAPVLSSSMEALRRVQRAYAGAKITSPAPTG